MKSGMWKTSVILLSLSLIISSSSFASEATEAQTGFSLTPRAWFSYIDTVDDELTSTEAFFLPMYGLTVSVTPKATPNLNFMLTGLYGEGDGEYVTFWGPEGDSEAERTDLEFLVRYNFPGKNFSIFAGPRYVVFDVEDDAGSFRAETDTTLWVIEVGAGTVVPISDDGRHRFFSNFTLGAAFLDYDYEETGGYTESDSAVYPSIDFNFGYQYSIGSLSSFSIRYRAFILLEENDFNQLRHNTLHGPEAAFTITF